MNGPVLIVHKLTMRQGTALKRIMHNRITHQRSLIGKVFFDLPAYVIIILLMFLITPGSSAYAWQAASESNELSVEEAKEKAAVDKFLELLVKRPATGTALDRVFGYHVERASITALIDQLTAKANGTQGDESGRLWFLIGLLQLQRGEDAQAVAALAKAQEILKENAMVAFHHGQALILVGDTDRAAAALEISISRKPPRADYLNVARELGRLYQRAGRVEDALRIWNTLEKDFPGDDSVRQRIASTLAEEGDLKGALARYESLAKSAKVENDRISYALEAANLRSQLGQKPQAIDELDTILAKLRPGSYLYDEARRRVERIFLSSGDFVGLTEYYQRWLTTHPDDLTVLLRLARTLSLQGRSAEAIERFEQAIERAPSDPAPRLSLIDALLAESRYADAARQFEPLIADGQNNPDYLVKYGQVIMSDAAVPEAQRQQAAADIWKRLITARPQDAAVHSQVADLLRGAKLHEEAIALYRQAIKLAPDEPQHKEYLGEYLHQLNRPDEALDVWRSLAEGALRTRDNLVRLAEVLHQFQQPAEALTTMREACSLKPQVAHRLRYIEWLVDAKEYQQANEQLTLARQEAESVEDRARVFSAAVKTYQAAGELTQRIEQATAAAQAAPGDADKWRQLAVLHEAAQAPSEALQAIEQAIAADPNSIDTLDAAARMAQNAGRLPESLEYRKRLVDIDRRFRTAHLQRLATLYASSGQNDLAISTGKEMLMGAGGAIEAFKFYADLCGQVGLRDERLDTLRRCVRLNPRSGEAQRWLADQLSSDFKTDQAIELFWKILDVTEEIDKKREVVGKLTELYLRSNRLDQLINRLEFRGREANDRRTTADLVSSAYQQAGDLGLARETLETLLRESGRDTVLLERMVTLCEQAGEVNRAIELQRELIRVAPSKQSQTRLASLLIDIGAVEEAQSLWLSTVDARADALQLGRQVDRLFSTGEQRAAVDLAKKVLELNPQDWEMLLRRMVLFAESGSWKEAVADADRLWSLNFPDDTPSSQSQAALARGQRGQPASRYPKRLQRIQGLYELYYLIDPRYSSSNRGLPSAMDFGHAKAYARYIQLKFMSEEKPEELATLLETSKEQALKPEATVDQVWDWFASRSMTENILQQGQRDYRDPSTWEDVWRLAEVDEESGGYQLTNLISSRMNMQSRGGPTPEPMTDQQLQRLKHLFMRDDNRSPLSASSARYSLPVLLVSELKLAGKQDQTQALMDQMWPKEPTPQHIASSLPFLATYGTDDQLWAVMEMAMDPKNKQVIQQNSVAFAYQLVNQFIVPERVSKLLSPGAADPVYRERCFKLLDYHIKAASESRSTRTQLRLSSMGMERRTYNIVNGYGQEVLISFPPTGLGPEDSILVIYRRANDELKSHLAPWLEQLVQSVDGMEPRLRIQRLLVAAIFHQWNDRTNESIKILQQAIDVAAKEVTYEETPLRLLLADLLLRQSRQADALQAIEGITVYDQGAMTVREFAAARLAVALGDQERAKKAARRLFGVRLDTDAQIALAKLMHSLQMPELADDLVRRMRGRTGASTAQLQTLMAYFQSQQSKDQAAEVAIELLQRTAPMAKRNGRSTSAEQAGRASALQVLASAGRLNDLIANTEKRLERAPKSQRIKTELMEMYVAAGQNDKVQAILDKDDNGSTPGIESTTALEAMVKQLNSAGKTKELCDVYLKLLKRKPQLFRNEYFEIVQPFRQANRLEDLVDLVLEVGVKRFESYHLGELCSELNRADKASTTARRLLLAIIDQGDVRSNGNLNSVIHNAGELLKDREVFEKLTAMYVDAARVSSGNWQELFTQNSTSGEARATNGLTLITHQAAEVPELLDHLEDKVRQQLGKHPKWYEGQAWLGMILVERKQYAEAIALLEPLIDLNHLPVISYDACWLIGSYIDTHEAMRPLAAKMYDFALGSPHQDGDNDFQFSLPARACRLAAEMDQKPRGREILRAELARSQTKTNRPTYNADYEAYRRLQSTFAMVALMRDVEAYADALKVARALDRADFEKSRSFGGGVSEEDFDQRIDEILVEVRKQGGLTAITAMIDPQPKTAWAIDLGISLTEQPFTRGGLDSIWLDLLADLQAKADQAKADQAKADQAKADQAKADQAKADQAKADQAAEVEQLVAQLTQLRADRPDDLSVQVALAIATSRPDSFDALTQLIQNPPDLNNQPDATQSPASLKAHAEMLGCALLCWEQLVHHQQPTSDCQPVLDWIEKHTSNWPEPVRIGLVASLGKQLFERQDTAGAARVLSLPLQWTDCTPMQLLDLASAAVNQNMAELAGESAIKSASLENAASAKGEVQPTNSLGQLLGANQATPRSVNNPFDDQADAGESKLVRALLQLDSAWAAKEWDATQPIAWMSAWTIPPGKQPNPMAIEAGPNNENKLAVESVFDRLATRAAQANQTEAVSARLAAPATSGQSLVSSPLQQLLAAHLWLRAKQAEKAAAKLNAIDPISLPGLPSAQCLQTLVLALEEDATRLTASKLALDLIGRNKPTQQYQEVEPYLSLALKLSQVAIERGLDKQLRDTAINAYIEYSIHDNQRYGGSYGTQRLIGQNEEIARALLMRGEIAEALKYLAKRQPAYNLGYDQSNDWVGSWALESIQGNSDRAAVYKILADWTFEGDGALQTIFALSRRAPLPAWIPESVGGKYPTFAPASDPSMPWVSNFLSLAHLSRELKNSDDLKQRFEAARQQKRAGADTGLAILLAVLQQPIPPEILETATQRVSQLPVNEVGTEGSTPLSAAELQLAILLASDEQHRTWSQQIIDRIAKVSLKPYLLPWLARWQYQRGGLEFAAMKPANSLEYWVSNTLGSAHDFYEGDTPGLWLTDGQGSLAHICGFAADHMWMRYPLTGNFELQFDTPLRPAGTMATSIGGVEISISNYGPQGTYLDISGLDYRGMVRTQLLDLKTGSPVHQSISGDEKTLTVKVNDRVVYTEPRSSAPLWLSLMANGTLQNSASHIKLNGQPTIPKQVDLLGSGRLREWTGVYYNQSLPGIGLTDMKSTSDENYYHDAGIEPGKIEQLSWTMQGDELISGGAGMSGPGNQSVVQFSRPLSPGDKLQYEFFYEPGKHEVHPAMGRTAFILKPEGVHWHWMTEPNTSWGTPADYEVKAEGTLPVDLKAGQWNKVVIETSGDRLRLLVNDQLALDQAWDYTTPAANFGLFHYRGKSAVRVRQVQLSGEWPDKFPPSLFSAP